MERRPTSHIYDGNGGKWRTADRSDIQISQCPFVNDGKYDYHILPRSLNSKVDLTTENRRDPVRKNHKKKC